MSSKADLAALLGVPEQKLSMLAGLTDSDLTHLEACLRAVMEEQDRAVAEGIERSLKAIPRPLRGRARSLLFPGDGE